MEVGGAVLGLMEALLLETGAYDRLLLCVDQYACQHIGVGYGGGADLVRDGDEGAHALPVMVCGDGISATGYSADERDPACGEHLTASLARIINDPR